MNFLGRYDAKVQQSDVDSINQIHDIYDPIVIKKVRQLFTARTHSPRDGKWRKKKGKDDWPKEKQQSLQKPAVHFQNEHRQHFRPWEELGFRKMTIRVHSVFQSGLEREAPKPGRDREKRMDFIPFVIEEIGHALPRSDDTTIVCFPILQ
jgi:hypothetical protein